MTLKHSISSVIYQKQAASRVKDVPYLFLSVGTLVMGKFGSGLGEGGPLCHFKLLINHRIRRFCHPDY